MACVGRSCGHAEGMWAQLLVFFPCLVWNAPCLSVLACDCSPHSCTASQHGSRRRAVCALWLHAFSSTSKVCLVCSLCHFWPHLVACRHAGVEPGLCLQMAVSIQASPYLWKRRSQIHVKQPEECSGRAEQNGVTPGACPSSNIALIAAAK